MIEVKSAPEIREGTHGFAIEANLTGTQTDLLNELAHLAFGLAKHIDPENGIHRFLKKFTIAVITSD